MRKAPEYTRTITVRVVAREPLSPWPVLVGGFVSLAVASAFLLSLL
ncbi:hypothetical protein [Magnetofaba australis]|nr:hypothetical protein [Magnetofaba australis]